MCMGLASSREWPRRREGRLPLPRWSRCEKMKNSTRTHESHTGQGDRSQNQPRKSFPSSRTERRREETHMSYLFNSDADSPQRSELAGCQAATTGNNRGRLRPRTTTATQRAAPTRHRESTQPGTKSLSNQAQTEPTQSGKKSPSGQARKEPIQSGAKRAHPDGGAADSPPVVLDEAAVAPAVVGGG